MTKDLLPLGKSAFLCYVMHVFCLCVDRQLVGNYEELKRFLYLCIELLNKEIWLAVALSKSWCISAKIPKSTQEWDNTPYLKLIDNINEDAKIAVSSLKMAVANATKVAYSCIKIAEMMEIARKMNSILAPPPVAIHPKGKRTETSEKEPEKGDSILNLLLKPTVDTIEIPTVDSYIDQYEKKRALGEKKGRGERPIIASGILRKILVEGASYSTIYPSPPYSGSSVSVKVKTTVEKGKISTSSRYQYAKKSDKPSAEADQPSIGVKTFQQIAEKSSSLKKSSEGVQVFETGKPQISGTQVLTSSDDDSVDKETTQKDSPLCGLDTSAKISLSGSVAKVSSGEITSKKLAVKKTLEGGQESPRKKKRISEDKSESVAETSSSKTTGEELTEKDTVEEGQGSPRKRVKFLIAKSVSKSTSELKDVSSSKDPSGKGSSTETATESSTETATESSTETATESSTEKPKDDDTTK